MISCYFCNKWIFEQTCPDCKKLYPYFRYVSTNYDKISIGFIFNGEDMVWYLYPHGTIVKSELFCMGSDINGTHSQRFSFSGRANITLDNIIEKTKTVLLFS